MHKIIVNTQERAISTDINRLQAVLARDFSELFRYLFDSDGNDDSQAGGLMAGHTSLESPVRAEIANGLLVRPQIGSLAIIVESGCGMFVSPDSEPDSSTYKIVLDPGLSLSAPLALEPNLTADTRVDIIECRVGDPWEFFDSRDIYNPETGLFQAASVVKERAHRLEYRIRRGAPGAGFPFYQLGWLPLAVASVPANAQTCNDVTFWDVRPLLSDRVRQPFALTESFPEGPRFDGTLGIKVGGGNAGLMNGVVEAVLNGRRVGGILRRGSPGTDGNTVNLAEPGNQQNGGFTWSFAVNNRIHTYLACPFNIPRWSRYTDPSSGSRVPRSPRGIPILSSAWPDEAGKPLTQIGLPTELGLGSASTNVAVAFSYSQIGDLGDGYTNVPIYATGKRRETGDYAGIWVPLAENVSANVKKFRMNPGVEFPRNARKILTSIYFEVPVTADTIESARVEMVVYMGAYSGSGFDYIRLGEVGGYISNTGLTFSFGCAENGIDIPIPIKYPGPQTFFDVILKRDGAGIGNPQMTIRGFEY